MSEVPGPEPADAVKLAAGALAFGVTLGVGLLALVTWIVRSIQGSDLAIARTTRGLSAALLPVLLLGTLAAMAGAGIAIWTLLSPIDNPWRKAMLSIIGGAASFVVALITWPVDRAFGKDGLLGLLALSLLLCWLIGRRLSKGVRRPV